jgi:hypothetical protein
MPADGMAAGISIVAIRHGAPDKGQLNPTKCSMRTKKSSGNVQILRYWPK